MVSAHSRVLTKCLPPLNQNSNQRLLVMKKLWWDTVGVVPDKLKQALGPGEEVFLDKYDSLVGKYMDSVGINITADQTPPKDLMIQVRVLKVRRAPQGFSARVCLCLPVCLSACPFSRALQYRHFDHTQTHKSILSFLLTLYQPIGEIMFDDGPVDLELNTHHFLRRRDCELLIRQGLLEQVTDS